MAINWDLRAESREKYWKELLRKHLFFSQPRNRISASSKTSRGATQNNLKIKIKINKITIIMKKGWIEIPLNMWYKEEDAGGGGGGMAYTCIDASDIKKRFSGTRHGFEWSGITRPLLAATNLHLFPLVSLFLSLCVCYFDPPSLKGELYRTSGMRPYVAAASFVCQKGPGGMYFLYPAPVISPSNPILLWS